MIHTYPCFGIPFNSFDIFFSAMPVFMILFILMFFCIFIFIIVKNASYGLKNKHSPTLTVEAKVISKRTQYNSHRHMHNTASNTAFSEAGYNTFFVTFEFTSKDRLELKIDSSEFGYIVEGDIGALTFKGNKYISFERKLY